MAGPCKMCEYLVQMSVRDGKSSVDVAQEGVFDSRYWCCHPDKVKNGDSGIYMVPLDTDIVKMINERMRTVKARSKTDKTPTRGIKMRYEGDDIVNKTFKILDDDQDLDAAIDNLAIQAQKKMEEFGILTLGEATDEQFAEIWGIRERAVESRPYEQQAVDIYKYWDQMMWEKRCGLFVKRGSGKVNTDLGVKTIVTVL
jgi:hypothetical protein